MLTRATHARIYQGELTTAEYEELNLLARKRSASVQTLILEAIRAYLKNELLASLDVELVETDSSGIRPYLWVPYDAHSKIELIMKEKGSYIQGLVRKSIEAYVAKERHSLTDALSTPKIDDVLERVGLKDDAFKKVAAFSRGMRQ
jgi:hypothetical protein